MWDYRAKCMSVHDGDTVTMLMDTGFHGRQEEHIRLFQVFAPELSQPGGPETRQFVLNWMSTWQLATAQWPLYVVTEKNSSTEPQEIQTLARYVGTIWDVHKKNCLNNEINVFLTGHPEWGHGIGA